MSFLILPLWQIAVLVLITFSTIVSAQIPQTILPSMLAEGGSLVMVPAPLLVDHDQLTRTEGPVANGWRSQWIESPSWGGRIGYLDQNGNLFAAVGIPGNTRSNWVLLASDVADFQLMDWRVAVLKHNGALMFSEGPLNVRFRQIAADVTSFQMSLTRIGFTKVTGQLFVKEHGFLPRLIYDNVKSYHIKSDRLGVLTTSNKLYLSLGGHIGALSKVAENVEAFQLEREWIGIVQAHTLKIARGNINNLAFIDVCQAVTDFEMEVSVNLTPNGTSNLHIAAIDSFGNVNIGESAGATIALHKSHRDAKSAHWSGRQLAITGFDGDINTSMLLEDSSEGAIRNLGAPSLYSFNQEGALVLYRSGIGVNSIRTESGRSSTPKSVDLSRTDISSTLAIPPEWAEENVLNIIIPFAIKKIAISSIRPDYSRRAIEVH